MKLADIFLIILSYIPNSRIKTLYYIINGAKIGKNFDIGIGSFIRCLDYKDVKIMNNVTIMDNVIIDVKELIIGNNSSIGFGTVVKGKGILNIGQQSYIASKSYLDTSGGIYIGDEVGTSLLGGIFSHDYSSTWFNEGVKFKYSSVKIGNRTWIGPDTIISGAKIGSCCLIGAKSLVTNNINKNSVAVGNPCKVLLDNNRVRKLDSSILLNNVFNTSILEMIKSYNNRINVKFITDCSNVEISKLSNIKQIFVIFTYGFNNQFTVPDNIHIYDLDSKLIYNFNFKYEKYITGHLRGWGIFMHYYNYS